MASNACQIRRASTGDVVLAQARWCRSFWCRLRGLMFRRAPGAEEGLVFVFARSSIAATSIHMFFVFFPIAVLWLDEAGVVVHTALARPWRPYYAAPVPAKLVVEARPALLERVSLGDHLVIEDVQ